MREPYGKAVAPRTGPEPLWGGRDVSDCGLRRPAGRWPSRADSRPPMSSQEYAKSRERGDEDVKAKGVQGQSAGLVHTGAHFGSVNRCEPRYVFV